MDHEMFMPGGATAGDNWGHEGVWTTKPRRRRRTRSTKYAKRPRRLTGQGAKAARRREARRSRRKRVRRGEETVITKRQERLAVLSSEAQRPADRGPGSAAGQIMIADDFDDPLPGDILAGFEE